jgi:NAD(P)-dependent dehydrogenase (short-subunit alcohol dehydrogenase family)
MELEAHDFIATFSTNAVGPFLVVQQLLQAGLLGPPGSLVVNISSIMASHGDPSISSVTPGGYAYRWVGGAGVSPPVDVVAACALHTWRV